MNEGNNAASKPIHHYTISDQSQLNTYHLLYISEGSFSMHLQCSVYLVQFIVTIFDTGLLVTSWVTKNPFE